MSHFETIKLNYIWNFSQESVVREFLWDPVEQTMNKSLLRIVDPGPLRAPIASFVLRRNKDLELILETTTAREASSSTEEHPPGTLRRNEDKVRWENGFGFGATGTGAQPFSFKTLNDLHRGLHETVETSTLHSVEAEFPEPGTPAYTLDWLEKRGWLVSLAADVQPQRTIAEIRSIGLEPDGITITGVETEEGGSAACVSVASSIWTCISALDGW
jgi:hypothetical protein